MLFAMVGFAEGVISDALGMMCIGVFLVTLCAGLGLLLRSRVASVAGLFLALVTAYLFDPWEAFVQEPSDDSDAATLQAAYLLLARWWVLASVAAVAGVVWAVRRRRVDAVVLRDLTVADLARCPIWRYEGPKPYKKGARPASSRTPSIRDRPSTGLTGKRKGEEEADPAKTGWRY
jgi:hypothetical protein